MVKRILLYGNSIFLAGLAAQLQRRSGVEVRQQSPSAGRLELAGLDAVVVDFAEVAPGDVLAILRAQPDVKVVGVNAAGSAVTVLSGQVYLAHGVADVLEGLEE